MPRPNLNFPIDYSGLPLSQADAAIMQIALDFAQQSDDPKAKLVARSGVGAVLSQNQIVLVGSANRLPPRLRSIYSITDPESPERYHLLEHAERCAIFDATLAGADIRGSTIYCTRFPCSDCARAISYMGIVRLVTATGMTGETRWIESQQAALKILQISDIEIRYLDEV